MNNTDEYLQAISIGVLVACFLLNTRRGLKAIELCRECLLLLKEKPCIKGEKLGELLYMKDIYSIMANASTLISDNINAIKYREKLVQICCESGERLEECQLGIQLAKMYLSQSKPLKAKDLYEKALSISKEISCRALEACCYSGLGTAYEALREYGKCKENIEKSLAICQETGDRNGEACCYGGLGTVHLSVNEYEKAREYIERSLAISKEIGDSNGEARCYRNLGTVYVSVGEYEKAKEFIEKSLAICKEIGDRNGEASRYRILGNVYELVGEYEKAKECIEKSLAISKEIGGRNGKAHCYGSLGTVCLSVGKYEKAREYIEKSLAISKEIGDRCGEAMCYCNLGTTCHSVGEYERARKYFKKSLAIVKEIGNRYGEAMCYGNLGTVYDSVGEYEKSRVHIKKSLAIRKEIGDRNGEAFCYTKLGGMYDSVGEYEKARVYHKKSLAIHKTIGDRLGKARCYLHLGATLCNLGKYAKANKYYQKALPVTTDIGDRRGKAFSYRIQGNILRSIGDVAEAKEHFEKALSISQEIGERAEEAENFLQLGKVYCNLKQYAKAEQYVKRGLEICEKTGDVKIQFESFQELGRVRMKEGKIFEAISCFLEGIKKCEDIRSSLRHNDQFKISFSDENIRSYRDLSALLCQTENPYEALYASELGKARALADLMSAQYSAQNRISADPQTWTGIERVMDKECNCTCLYVSYHWNCIFFWILTASGVMHFRMTNGKKVIADDGIREDLNEFLNFRSFGILPEELCEDRSLNVFEQESESCEEDCHEGARIPGQESKDNQARKMNLPLCHKLIIAPVADLLEGREIIIVPDRALYNVPFAALPDEKGKYFSENYRVRLAPSLTTLKLIHESPPDYHSQTGALVVGNPDVGRVCFSSGVANISRLPSAEREAKMVGEKLNVEPLIGQHATKQAVLQAMKSVSLIHIAAHGNAERGEIALAPAFRASNRLLEEEDCLLTMSDISKVQLRAKLVVLSCCHSARGEIKAEGAVGIARAFLGSGARSVLVALWAIKDCATEHLMSRFYEHLVDGKSASESLHEAMKWMRSNGFSDSDWAPFVLIGDNLTFDFGKKGKNH